MAQRASTHRSGKRSNRQGGFGPLVPFGATGDNLEDTPADRRQVSFGTSGKGAKQPLQFISYIT